MELEETNHWCGLAVETAFLIPVVGPGVTPCPDCPVSPLLCLELHSCAKVLGVLDALKKQPSKKGLRLLPVPSSPLPLSNSEEMSDRG